MDRGTIGRCIAYGADLPSPNGVTVIVAAFSPHRTIRDEAPTRLDLMVDAQREIPHTSAATLRAHIDARSGKPRRGTAGEPP